MDLRELLRFAETNRVVSATEIDAPLLSHTGLDGSFRTATLIGLEAPDVGFGTHLRYGKYGIDAEVPEDFRGVSNAALVIEIGPSVHTFDKGSRVLSSTSVKLIEDFPNREGWRVLDPTTGLPIKPTVQFDTDARFLMLPQRPYLGAVARITTGPPSYFYERVVDLSAAPEVKLPVAVVLNPGESASQKVAEFRRMRR